MTERQATFCGYALATVLACVVSLGAYLITVERRSVPVVNPVTVTSWVDDKVTPHMLYVLAHIKPGYRIYPCVMEGPNPFGAELHLDTNPCFTAMGEWTTFIPPGASDKASVVFWGLKIDGDAEWYHLTGTLRVTVYNDEACRPPEYIGFEATP